MKKITKRADGRSAGELRPVRIQRDFNMHAEGSVLIEVGNTKVICTVSVEERVPPFCKELGQGWVTAEYAMLPRSTNIRIVRESVRGHPGGRTYEIQRLVGRSLRSVVDLSALGERTFHVDCDVIQADGGTRTSAITGSFVALVDAMGRLHKNRRIDRVPVTDYVAATSVGIVDGRYLLDLSYEEDSNAQVDMNVVMTGKGKFVEIQGTAEGHPFLQAEMDRLTRLAKKGVRQLVELQKSVLNGIPFAWT
jgi:ribonuclease PH